MNSIDTNILIYAVNSGCPEHLAAKKVYEMMLSQPQKWIISDQVLFEFYRALRNSKILEYPLDHENALRQIRFLREKSGVLHCAYETRLWKDILKYFKDGTPRSSHIFDSILAVTLIENGVKSFYTRNIKDFEGFSFDSLVNPIDQSE